MSEITFKIDAEINEYEIEGVKNMIKILQDLVDRAMEKKEIPKKVKIPSLKKIETTFEKIMEEAAKEPELEGTVKQDGSIDCGCGSNVIPRNVNRHKRTKKHIDWALANGQL